MDLAAAGGSGGGNAVGLRMYSAAGRLVADVGV